MLNECHLLVTKLFVTTDLQKFALAYSITMKDFFTVNKHKICLRLKWNVYSDTNFQNIRSILGTGEEMFKKAQKVQSKTSKQLSSMGITAQRLRGWSLQLQRHELESLLNNLLVA